MTTRFKFQRRLPALALLVAAIAAVIAGTRNELDASTPTFSVSANGWMPAAPPIGGLTETWFCSGVPATGGRGRRRRGSDREPHG